MPEWRRVKQKYQALHLQLAIKRYSEALRTVADEMGKEAAASEGIREALVKAKLEKDFPVFINEVRLMADQMELALLGLAIYQPSCESIYQKAEENVSTNIYDSDGDPDGRPQGEGG